MRPDFYVGTQFADRTGRRFKVMHCIMGSPDQRLSWTLETQEGYKITCHSKHAPQTSVGFIELNKEGAEMIYITPQKLKEYINNNHLILLL